MIVKFYFVYNDNSEDEIILTADTEVEMNKLLAYEMNKRGAEYIGHEVIES